ATPTRTRPADTATPTVPTATASATSTATATPTPTLAGAQGAVAPLTGAGRWFVDALGRVVMLHGVNMVEKSAPFYPAAFGFGADDAAFLAAEGFNSLRLGVDFRGLMPTPGIVETEYIEHLAETVDVLTQHGIFVLIDFHQDGFAPMFNGNGLPDWLAIGDGLPNPPDAVFPLYYIQNPAMQRAFENFWANRDGPEGIGLQDYFFQGLEAVVARFADEPLVLGTELMNEPWPGAVYLPCATDLDGCPDLEAERLGPFYQRGVDAARRLAPAQLVFVEPFVLFNFGMANTTLPGAQPGRALSFHSYALNLAGEEGVVSKAIAAAERDAAPLLLTEFGATIDPVALNRLTAQMEHGLVPWMFWAYNESIIADLEQPAGPDNLRSRAAFDALVRPYPIATTGTPTEIAFDPTTRTFRLAYETTGPGGAPFDRNAVTVVSVPRRHYPDGYAVSVAGAVVTSLPCAELLTLHNESGAERVSLEVAPAAGGCAPVR
ncbi:MAG: cellulase family glycosylhydrolase, partial [Candidatus Binatia bacterium]